MDSEIWKPIQVQGFEGLYLISNLGNVWSVRKNKNLKHGINGGGYKFVVIMVQYRKSDGTLGEFDSDKLLSINVKGHTFTITLRNYFYDEYEWEDEEITDVVEIRI